MGERVAAAGRRVALALVAAGLVAAGMLAAALSRPARYEVDGLSMAPGLMPGDVVATDPLSILTGRREPRRFERWVLAAADGGAAIKRVAGLPGERISIDEGDLLVDGRRIVAPPPILAETASAVPGFGLPEAAPGGRPCRHAAAAGVVLDDADFAPTERRLLLPVRDVGLAAVIRIADRPSPALLRARVGPFVVGWRPPTAGTFAVVAGRLDGHLVAACWRCDAAAPHGRSCLPAGGPTGWQIERPWPDDAAPGETTPDAAATPPLAVWLGSGAPPSEPDAMAACDEQAGTIERFVVWRDVLYRPAADGRVEWRLGAHEFFVLGDFPSGSRDSRHWGPLRREPFVAPVWAAR